LRDAPKSVEKMPLGAASARKPGLLPASRQ
jgi:hypothetical protein